MYEIYDDWMGCWLDARFYTFDDAENHVMNMEGTYLRYTIYLRVS